MKFKVILSIILLAGVATFYTACKKSGTDASGPALSASEVSSQVALDLSQNLFGDYTGINFGGGLNAPSGFATKKHINSRVMQSLNNPFCGLVIDTTLNETVTAGADSSISVAGHIKFSFNCTGDNLTGFSTDDNLTIKVSTPQIGLSATILENITLASLDPKVDTANFSLSGSLSETGAYVFKTGTKRAGTRSFSYVLSNLVIDSNGDIISGTASFTTKGSGPKGSWAYAGTITFLPGHKVTITISGKTYNVNLQTGVVG
ncbi:hypothetical protein [Mucilaginibacter xinganensis]|uniref:DUF5689 domain-containing protein n=1 Tax=Mucilaginibacter xinganensis TaxID=1234841 RepID=A0A223P0U4_9SPHI|nr:hypothetical protein [Mucilaginibacter xinganensis]ASU35707.1 hypothetical protein MuYL_3822 [Mucilaginibacter xinganensis]